MKQYDDIKTSMNKSEITIIIFADYSKAFDTIDFYTLIQKMHSCNFSQDFLYSTMDYLTFRQHFVQIDAHFSPLLISEFGVPQGSIRTNIQSMCHRYSANTVTQESEYLQYVDDTTLYRACKTSQRH